MRRLSISILGLSLAAMGPPLVAPAMLAATRAVPATDGPAGDLPVPGPGAPGAGGPPPSVSVAVTPDPFSPNGDGRMDRAQISVAADHADRIGVRVRDRAGAEIASWSLDAPGTVEWDGAGAPDGAYVVEADARGPGGTDQDREEVRVDRKGPRVRWARSPSLDDGRGWHRSRVRVRDRSGVAGRLVVRDATSMVRDRRVALSPGRSRVGIRARPRGLYPGTYTTELLAADAAGNRSRISRTWRVERPAAPRVHRRILGAGRRVALTFDDCHYERAWRRILRILRQRRAEATFFCPGRMMASHAHLTRRAARAGHTLGAHGWDHRELAGSGVAASAWTMRADARAAWRLGEVTTAPYFRPPYGSYDRAVVRAAGRSGHPRVIMWDVDPLDWQRPGARAIAARVLRGVRPGSIVLLHTIDQTADALPRILGGLRAKGLRPVTLPELFRAAGMP